MQQSGCLKHILIAIDLEDATEHNHLRTHLFTSTIAWALLPFRYPWSALSPLWTRFFIARFDTYALIAPFRDASPIRHSVCIRPHRASVHRVFLDVLHSLRSDHKELGERDRGEYSIFALNCLHEIHEFQSNVISDPITADAVLVPDLCHRDGRWWRGEKHGEIASSS